MTMEIAMDGSQSCTVDLGRMETSGPKELQHTSSGRYLGLKISRRQNAIPVVGHSRTGTEAIYLYEDHIQIEIHHIASSQAFKGLVIWGGGKQNGQRLWHSEQVMNFSSIGLRLLHDLLQFVAFCVLNGTDIPGMNGRAEVMLSTIWLNTYGFWSAKHRLLWYWLGHWVGKRFIGMSWIQL